MRGREVVCGQAQIRPIRAHPERFGAAKLEVSPVRMYLAEIARCRRRIDEVST
jgi:hypothetical protein